MVFRKVPTEHEQDGKEGREGLSPWDQSLLAAGSVSHVKKAGLARLQRGCAVEVGSLELALEAGGSVGRSGGCLWPWPG